MFVPIPNLADMKCFGPRLGANSDKSQSISDGVGIIITNHGNKLSCGLLRECEMWFLVEIKGKGETTA